MRIKIEKYQHMARVTVRVPLHGEGYAEHAFYTETVPVIELDEDVQAEVFVSGDVEIFNARDHDKIRPGNKLSVWRGKVPTNRR